MVEWGIVFALSSLQFSALGDFFKRSLFHVYQKKKQTSDFFFFLKATNKESTQGKKLTDIHSRW